VSPAAFQVTFPSSRNDSSDAFTNIRNFPALVRVRASRVLVQICVGGAARPEEK
jgi:hypothetical protein